jgi:hypothetical protein
MWVATRESQSIHNRQCFCCRPRPWGALPACVFWWLILIPRPNGAVVDYVCANWNQPDLSIWEVRNQQKVRPMPALGGQRLSSEF